mgnify:CR=1 FL=1
MRCIMVSVSRRRTRKVHARYDRPTARHVVVIISSNGIGNSDIGSNGIGNSCIGNSCIGSNVGGSIDIGGSQCAERKSSKSYKNNRHYCFAKHFF